MNKRLLKIEYPIKIVYAIMFLVCSGLLGGCTTTSNSDKFAFAQNLPKPDIPPKMTKVVRPTFPEKLHALDSIPEGKVTVIFVVETDGTVVEAKAKGADPRLRRAAIDAIKQCSFEPGMKDGQAVRCAQKAVSVFDRDGRPDYLPSGHIPRQIPAPR